MVMQMIISKIIYPAFDWMADVLLGGDEYCEHDDDGAGVVVVESVDEIIVVDGGSTDNSVDVIRKYAEDIDFWVSERDNGQSHAFNKGFSVNNYFPFLTKIHFIPLRKIPIICSVDRQDLSICFRGHIGTLIGKRAI